MQKSSNSFKTLKFKGVYISIFIFILLTIGSYLYYINYIGNIWSVLDGNVKKFHMYDGVVGTLQSDINSIQGLHYTITNMTPITLEYNSITTTLNSGDFQICISEGDYTYLQEIYIYGALIDSPPQIETDYIKFDNGNVIFSETYTSDYYEVERQMSQFIITSQLKEISFNYLPLSLPGGDEVFPNNGIYLHNQKLFDINEITIKPAFDYPIMLMLSYEDEITLNCSNVYFDGRAKEIQCYSDTDFKLSLMMSSNEVIYNSPYTFIRIQSGNNSSANTNNVPVKYHNYIPATLNGFIQVVNTNSVSDKYANFLLSNINVSGNAKKISLGEQSIITSYVEWVTSKSSNLFIAVLTALLPTFIEKYFFKKS